MPQLLTPAFLTPYFKDGKKHKSYVETVKIMRRLKVHADGEIPEDLIKKQRPSEEDATYKYRISIYEALTEEVVGKILTSLGKIRKSRDWHINFNDDQLPSKLKTRTQDTLRAYTETEFPFFKNFTTWLFNVCLKNYVVDPNGIVMVIPLDINVKDGEFIRPYPFIFNSDSILEFVQDKYVVVKSTDNATYSYKDKNGKSHTGYDGKVYYAADTNEIQRWAQIDAEGNLAMTWSYQHNLNMLPAYKLGGVFYKALDTDIIFKSRCNPIIGRLNMAANEISDLQAEVTQHVHSEKYVHATSECTSCQGTGLNEATIGSENVLPCSTCKGSRYLSVSPYKHIIVTPPRPGEAAVPNPPVGYVQKDVQIVKVQDERIQNHFYYAYAAISMENLSRSPLNQSGIAKEVDRDEQHVFVHGNAEDLVAIAEKFMNIANEYRYRVLITDESERRKCLPMINVPQKYDILGSAYLIDEIDKATKAGANPLIIKNLQVELAGKQFSDNPKLKAELQITLDLDPLFGLTDDQKMSRLQNKGVTQLNYTISSGIGMYVRRAMLEKGEEFIKLPPQKQMEVITDYAQADIDDMTPSATVKKMIATPDAVPATAVA